jgi:hypothetical protein
MLQVPANLHAYYAGHWEVSGIEADTKFCLVMLTFRHYKFYIILGSDQVYEENKVV